MTTSRAVRGEYFVNLTMTFPFKLTLVYHHEKLTIFKVMPDVSNHRSVNSGTTKWEMPTAMEVLLARWQHSRPAHMVEWYKISSPKSRFLFKIEIASVRIKSICPYFLGMTLECVFVCIWILHNSTLIIPSLTLFNLTLTTPTLTLLNSQTDRAIRMEDQANLTNRKETLLIKCLHGMYSQMRHSWMVFNIRSIWAEKVVCGQLREKWMIGALVFTNMV